MIILYTFANAFESIGKRYKRSIAKKSLSIKSPNFKQEDEAFMLSLDSVCYDHGISSGVRYVPYKIVPAKVFGDTYR